MKKKLISMLTAAIMLVSLFGITPALADTPAGSATVSFSGPDTISPGQTYTYTYTMTVNNVCAANANISVGGAFEKVSGGENLFYDTIPLNGSGSVSGSVTVRVKSDAGLGSSGTISVVEAESTCSTVLDTTAYNLEINTVTGSASIPVGPAVPSTPSVSFVSTSKLQVQWDAVSGAGGYQVFLATSANGSYSCVDTTAGNSSLISGLTPNTAYYFRIRAFHQSEPNHPIFGELSRYGAGATRPDTPSAPAVTFVSGNKLLVQWNAVGNASGYQVFRSTSANGSYICVDTTASNSSLITGLSPNTAYYFRIRAFYQSEPNNPTFGELSTYGAGVTMPDTPSAPSVTFVSGNKLRVQWNAVTTAGGYQVFRSTSANGPYVCVDTTASTSSLITGLSSNTAYYFRIRAFYQSEPNNPTFGDLSTYGVGVTMPGTPSAPSVTPIIGNKLRIQWNAVSDAGGYQVFLATSPNSSYVCVDTTAGTSSLITGLSSNTTYYIRIRAFYQSEPNNPTFGELSTYGAGTTQAGPLPPSAPSVTSVSASRLQVQWNAVADAGGYQVFRSTSPNGTYVCVDTTAGTSSLVTGLSSNTTYYFRIRAFCQTEPNNPTFGELSTYGAGTTQPGPATPSAPSVTFVSTSKLLVQWNAVANAGGYQVFYATSPNDSYVCVDTTAGTSSLITGLSSNTTYYFRIRAFYQTEPNNPTFGDLSSYGAGSTKPATPSAPSVTFVAGDKQRVQWNAVANAGGYQVFRATSANGTFVCVDTTASTTSLSTGLSPYTTYYYKVRAFYQSEPNNPTFGDLSSYGAGITRPDTSSSPSATFVAGDKLRVQWNAVSTAGGYQVFLSTSPNGTYVCVDTTSGTSSLITGLSPYTTYYFRIRAFYQSEPNNPIFGELSDYGAGVTRPDTPTAPSVSSVSSNTLQVQWNAVATAGGYQVFRATSANGTYVCVDTTASTSSLITGLSSGTTYYFKIRAFYQSEPNNPTFGELSSYGSGTT